VKTKYGHGKRKYFVQDKTKLKRAQEYLGTRTETETIERALDAVIAASERDGNLRRANKCFIKSGVEIRDVFARLRGR
jgi:dsRNA-specific ribonuclease